MSRNRTIHQDANQGSAFWSIFGTTLVNQSGGTFHQRSSHCEDVIDGTHNDHPLLIEHIDRSGINPLTGQLVNIVHNKKYEGWVPLYWQNLSGGHSTISTSIDPGSSLMAKTNPSRPGLNVPVFIGELKDIPELFKIAGRTLLKKGANAFLSYQYGWKPLISDLGKALRFQDHFSNRESELRRLYDKGGLRRRITLSSGMVKEDLGVVYVESNLGTLIGCHVIRETSWQEWGTIRWLPTSLPPTTDEGYRKLARGAYLGMVQTPRLRDGFVPIVSNVWQIMPWSWLVDWFSSAGDFLEAHRNTIPAESVSPNRMLHVTSRYIATRQDIDPDAGNFTGGDGVLLYETKHRSQPTASLAAALPFLSGRQMSILGALGIQRLRI